MGENRRVLPFSSIVGLDAVKEALILNAINPSIGGLLINGTTGTAKSLAVRSFAELIDEKITEIPLSVSEDRLIGSIDLEQTIYDGTIKFQPGILASADKGILYIDEVNLLRDNIVDLLLGVSTEGYNHIEREGMSYGHPCDFIMIGTMNSEDGEIRSQFLDRFGLYAQTEQITDPVFRKEIIKRRLEFELNEIKFFEKYKNTDKRIRDKINQARNLLSEVRITEDIYKLIAQKCLEAGTDGHRADIIMADTVRAVAAWHGKTEIEEKDIDEAAYFVLPHRSKPHEHNQDHDHEHEEHDDKQKQEKNNQDETDPSQESEKQDSNSQDSDDERNKNESDEPDSSAEESESQTDSEPLEAESDRNEMEQENSFDSNEKKGEGESSQAVCNFETGIAFDVIPYFHSNDRKIHRGSGKRTEIKTDMKSGRYCYPRQSDQYDDLALDATIRAAAPNQKSRKKKGDVAISIRSEDICRKVRQKRVSNLLIFVVDASGSMGADKRMIAAKGAVLSLLRDAYVKRDRIAMVIFRQDEAKVILPPTRSATRGYRLLDTIDTGGKTPLNDGVLKAMEIIRSEMRKIPDVLPMIIFITDGKGNVSIDKTKKPYDELMEIGKKLGNIKQIETMVIDIEKSGFMRFGLAKNLAEAIGAKYYHLEQIESRTILNLLTEVRK